MISKAEHTTPQGVSKMLHWSKGERHFNFIFNSYPC